MNPGYVFQEQEIHLLPSHGPAFPCISHSLSDPVIGTERASVCMDVYLTDRSPSSGRKPKEVRLGKKMTHDSPPLGDRLCARLGSGATLWPPRAGKIELSDKNSPEI